MKLRQLRFPMDPVDLEGQEDQGGHGGLESQHLKEVDGQNL